MTGLTAAHGSRRSDSGPRTYRARAIHVGDLTRFNHEESGRMNSCRHLRRGLSLRGLIVGLLLAAAPIAPAHAGCRDTPARDVDWSGCIKHAKMLASRDLSGANFARTDLTRSNLTGVTLEGAKLMKATLNRTILRKANLTNADLSGAIGIRSYMDRAVMRGANLEKAELFRAAMEGVDLSDAHLAGAQLARADLRGATLDRVSARTANFARADLRGASLNAADLTRAYLYRTNLVGTDLSNVVGLDTDQLEIACGDTATKLPDGVKRPAAWPCAEG
jgi:uncharacterized protein YjbI with pentapeptide repeats